MKIIIVGGGKVGSALIRSLVEEDHDVTLIDSDEQVIKDITKRQDILGIVGNGADASILEEADIQHCDIFISLTEKDEVNMIAAVLAKRLGAKETVVRVRNPEYSNDHFRDTNFLGISQLINPEMITARHIANSIDFPNAQSVEYFSGGKIVLMEFKLSDQSKLAGFSLSQLRKKYGHITVCAIERQNQAFIPHGDTTLQSGDKIFITGKRSLMVKFHNSIKYQAVKSFLIIGAGKISYYLIDLLQKSSIRLKVLELRRDRAEFFSENFPDLHVVKGDGTVKSLLLEEGVEHYDAVATMTGVDEENILTSMYLETLGIAKNITKVNRTSLLDIIGDKSFSTIVTPKLLAVDSMMHFIRGRENAVDSNLEALYHIASGQIEVLQFKIAKESEITQKTLEDLSFKPDVLIMAVIRNGKPLFPTGEDKLRVEDKVIVASQQKNINHISDLLK